MSSIPELLAPTGTLQKLRVALAYGADAVYAGAAGFSMRPDGAAFTVDDLREGVKLAQSADKKFYVALNSMAFNDDLGEIEKWLDATVDIKFNAFIIGDAGIFDLCAEKRPEVQRHISTQMGVANYRSARFWKERGASRVILARESTLDNAAGIAAKSGAEIEIFIHGAMCVAVSGRCLLSAHLAGRSGSRGDCKHACRWDYQLVEQKRPELGVGVFETGKETVFLGSKDLCLIGHIPEVIHSGVASVKIEGRMKSEYYLAVTVSAYRKALDAYAADGADAYVYNPEWLQELESVSHRPFCTGFAFGYPDNDPASMQCENYYYSTHEFCGWVTAGGKVFVKNPFREGEKLQWLAPDGSQGELLINEIKSPTGGAWPIARPAHEVSVNADSSLPPYLSMLRRQLPVSQ